MTRAPVKRYRMSYRDGIRQDDGTLIWPADASKPMVLAEDYDSLASALDRLEREVGELRQYREWAEPQIVQHGKDVQRIEALEAGLRKIVARWPSTTNPNCDDYERAYGQATSDIAQIARALLATAHNRT